MNEKFFVKTNDGYYIGLHHYEGVTKVIYNQLYEIARNNPHGKFIPENFIQEEIKKLVDSEEVKYVKRKKQMSYARNGKCKNKKPYVRRHADMNEFKYGENKQKRRKD